MLADEAELAVELVCEVVLDATIAAADVDIERQVILEEIAMRDDDPEDTLADLFAGAVFAGHPVASPVIGSVETITAMTRTQVAGYYRRRYTPDKMVVVGGRRRRPRRRPALGAKRPSATGSPVEPRRRPAPPRAGQRPGQRRCARATVDRAGHRAGAPVRRGAVRRLATTPTAPCWPC